MHPKILLGRIIQRMIDQGYAKVEGYNTFTYVSHFEKKLIVGRENGKDTSIQYDAILKAIEKYQSNPGDYDLGPSKTREYVIAYINSPVWSLLHLLGKRDYEITS